MNARRTSGAVAIEFALVGLVFFSLLLLAMETAWQLVINSALGAGARAASRFGSTGTVVAAGITPPPADRDHLDRRRADPELGRPVAGGSTPDRGGELRNFCHPCEWRRERTRTGQRPARWSGTTFTYTQPYLTPIAAAITGDTQMIHHVQVVVLNEPFPTD